ncbi:MAG: AraC family transcriptional regulator ligand-binding domain-containing protein [Halioglobus sp.]|nr:AraC family transcriptional regulator ligand-binding domain-containing protein [Halioglobus sp.]
MESRYETSSAYARLILQSRTGTAEELLSGSNLSAETIAQREFVDSADLLEVFRNYNRLVADRTWTARLGVQFNIGAHGPLGFAALSAPTLGAALDVIAELLPSRNTGMLGSTVATESRYELVLEDLSGEADYANWMTEVVLKIVEEMLSTILGHPLGRNASIHFAHPPPDQADRLARHYQGSVLFGEPQSKISIPLAWRNLPSPLYNEALYRTNIIQCRETIASMAQSGSTTGRVRNLLSKHFDTQLLGKADTCPPPTLEQMADVLHMSSRTLIRRLQREQRTYRDILEELRRQYSEQLLGDARLTVADVAEILGYREAANFGRAFRRWYGTSPAVWRRQ